MPFVQPPRELLKALGLSALELHAQGQFDGSGRIDGVELLLRATNLHGASSPAPLVVSQAAALGLGADLCVWSFEEAAAISRAFKAAGLSIKSRANLMEAQLVDAGVLGRLLSILDSEPDLEVELVESDRSTDVRAVEAGMRRLRAPSPLRPDGVRLWLDDFTGIPSDIVRLSWKDAAGRRLVSGLKLDKAFLDAARTERGPEEIAAAFALYDPHMDDILLEGVEGYEDLDLARQAGIGLIQGYHSHRAAPVSEKAIPFFLRHEDWRLKELARAAS